MKRIRGILKDEKIDFEKKVLSELIQKHYPDFRRILNELQRYSVRGKIDSILFSMSNENIKGLLQSH